MSERRIIVGPCRSGTTMLLRSVKNHPDALVEFQTIKAGQRLSGSPDHAFFTREVPEGKFLVNKETVGYGTEEDCTLEIFPNDESITETRPVFIFREPRATFASWMEQHLATPESGINRFVQAYKHTYALLMKAKAISPLASVVTYENFCADPKSHIEKLCERWNIAFHPFMIDWQDAFIDSTPLDRDGMLEGHYATVAKETGITVAKEKPELPKDLGEEIERTLGDIYRCIRR